MAADVILIIDDDEDILEITGALLRSEGFDVLSAVTVEKGLEIVRKMSPQLVLLDLVFPEDSFYGVKAAELIKRENPSMPVFMFSAVAREYAFGFRRSDVDVDEFLVKPVDTRRLVDMIRNRLKVQ